MNNPNGQTQFTAAELATNLAPVPMLCQRVAAALPHEPNPSFAAVAWLWQEAFGTFGEAVQRGALEKRTKRILIRFLAQRAPYLGCNEKAVRWNWGRLHKRWLLGGRKASAIMDGRPEANRKRRVQVPSADKAKIIADAIFQNGADASPAWRACLENGELSPEMSRYLLNPARSSHIPEAVAREVLPEIKLLWPHYCGPRQAKLNGAYIERDWSNVGAGDEFEMDDFTLEIYWAIPDGKGWWILTRGQFLPLIDRRSKKILDWLLIPERNYTARSIRSLINRYCSNHHLPRKRFHLECGIWKRAELLGRGVDWGEVRMTFAERLGIEITHAQPGNARSKLIENVGKLFQAKLRGLPGWVGPNEQALKLERVQAAKRDVEARRKTPEEAGFLLMEQMCAVLDGVCERYNSTPQDSDVMGGRFSPDEAWRLFQPRNAAGEVVPVVKLPEDCRWMLCGDPRPMKVGRNGLKLPASLGAGTYRNEVTGRLQYRTVKAYFDIGCPELLHIFDPDGKVFCIPRVDKCPASDATAEELSAAQASVAAHNRYAKERFSQLRHEYAPPTRTNMIDPRTAAIGREIKAQQQQLTQRKAARQRNVSQKRKLARAVGLHPGVVTNRRALELLNKARTKD